MKAAADAADQKRLEEEHAQKAEADAAEQMRLLVEAAHVSTSAAVEQVVAPSIHRGGDPIRKAPG